jgi:hypothetical protein
MCFCMPGRLWRNDTRKNRQPALVSHNHLSLSTGSDYWEVHCSRD